MKKPFEIGARVHIYRTGYYNARGVIIADERLNWSVQLDAGDVISVHHSDMEVLP